MKTKILSSWSGHDSSFCILEDGVPTIHAELERYIREKEKSELIKPVDPEKLIVTSGKKGAFYLGNMYPAIQSEVFDVCGAGDVFIACLSTFYLHTNDIIKSIKLSNAFSSVSVRFSGNYIIKINEVLSALQN